MAVPTTANKADFSEMDNAGISREHWKIRFISGMVLLPETKGKSLEELSEQPASPAEKAAA
ncbi:MAG: hypothetical protein WA510_27600 [Acidobacteriaceae bacterium]